MEINENLTVKLENKAPESFPNRGTVNYSNRYKTISEYLNINVHPHVNAVAMKIDGGYLTDHGPEHINTVIERASELIAMSTNEILTSYEIYILLVAIQIHDVGHIKNGRTLHEVNSKDVLKNLGNLLGTDNAERRVIWQIAEAHGGKVHGTEDDRDKIEKLEVSQPLFRETIKAQLLAAILRFSDELADDSSRAAKYLLANGGIPKESEVYHEYAKALHTVVIDKVAKEVKLIFELSKDNTTKTFGKGKLNEQGETIIEDVFLLDEIFERTLKMFRECIYCMRYIPSEIQIKSINVKIEIFEEFSPIHDPIGYRLRETGYPSFVYKSIEDVCKKEITIDGQTINGSILKNRIERL